MKRSQLLVLVAAAAAVGVIAVATHAGGAAHQPAAQRGRIPANAVVVSMATSPEKAPLVQSLARQYGATSPRVDGRPVVVRVRVVASGDEETAIARAARGRGGDRPVVWSPASSLWARLLDTETDRALVADRNPSIVRTPLVLAMWEPLARALGYPRRRIGFADILKLVRDPRGWAAYGHPEYGAFRLVHTNPSVSTSGLEAVSAEYFAAAGKQSGVTAADVRAPRVRRQIARIERSIVHYGDTTLFIADQLRRHGPAYASVVAMEETTLVDFNRHRGGQPKLVGIYPREGTFISDSPFIVLRAPWVSAAQRRAASAFQRFVARRVTAAVAARYGFRPPDPAARPAAPVDAAHGADPAEPPRILAPPSPTVLAAIQRAWLRNRKPADIELVLDTSGSMATAHKLAHAKQGLWTFLRALSPRDRVGLIAFSDTPRRLVPLTPVATGLPRLRQAIAGLLAQGATAVYDATARAVAAVQAVRRPGRIDAVVLLTDGEDTSSRRSRQAILSSLQREAGSEQEPIRVYTIAYGLDADRSLLARIAAASGGKPSTGDTGDIEAVYRSISSFF